MTKGKGKNEHSLFINQGPFAKKYTKQLKKRKDVESTKCIVMRIHYHFTMEQQ